VSVCVLCLSGASMLCGYVGGEEDGARCFIKFKGIKIRDQPVNVTFCQLIMRKIIKIVATRCHILRLKFTKFDSWCLSICLFVQLSVDKRANGRPLALLFVQMEFDT